jgi:Fe2+ or Zn2+ uptake regulation protein
MPAPTLHTDDLAALLRARGQRVTSQRLVILRELRRRGRHVDAHELGEAVRDQLPGTSTPTVYATLELLVELGLVRKLAPGTGTALYDARTEPHQHVVCRRCGRVEDLDIELDCDSALTAARATGFDPDAAELLIAGHCAGCARASRA